MTWVYGLLPLYAVAAGCLALWWDLRRREIAARAQAPPSPEIVERFSLDSLAELDARVQRVELSQGGILETVHAELDDARAERRSASSKKAGASKLTREREIQAPDESQSEDEQLAAIEANLGLAPPPGSA